MENEEYKPDEFSGNTEMIPDKLEEVTEEIKETAEDTFGTAADAAEEAAEAAEEKIEEISEAAEDVSDSMADAVGELTEEMAEAADDTAEAIDDIRDEVLDAAEDAAEDIFPEAEADLSEAEEAAAKAYEDVVEAVRYTAPDKPADELQKVHPSQTHEPSIPQYVPRTFESEAETPRSVRGSMQEPDPVDFPIIEDNVQPAPKGTLNADGGKPNNTVLWIILAVLVCMLVAGCCLIQAVFGILKFLGA